MNRLLINLDALSHNLAVIDRWMLAHGAQWTVVTKVLCGHVDTLHALKALGVRSVGDSRPANLRVLEHAIPDAETWYLRVPSVSSAVEVVRLADVSLNSELETIRALNEAARAQERTHRIVIMIELGDLREGILPGTLVHFYEQVFHLSNIDVIGVGANLGCLAGAVPTVDQFMQLVLYRELLELKFHRRLPLISAGSTAVLPLVLDGQLPKAINHFRIGEAIFLGTNLLTGGLLPDLRSDVVRLEAEVAEVKEKALTPSGETGAISPFANDCDVEELTPGQRGYRALVAVGHLDTDISGLTPIDPEHRIAGASSDITVVNIGDDTGGLKVGDTVEFQLNYSAMVRLMSSPYVSAVVQPDIDEFKERLSSSNAAIAPVLSSLRASNLMQATGASTKEVVLETPAFASTSKRV